MRCWWPRCCWRPGLIVLDPVTEIDVGRYPLPLRGGTPRLLLSPHGTRLLIAFGDTEWSCTESGGNAVVTDRDNLRAFRDFQIDDPHLRAWPGSPKPSGNLGRAAVLAVKGTRILAAGGARSLVVLDAGPFWSGDGATLFVPRQRDGTMLLDRFQAH